ncbi:hypothetical protein HWV62_33067 [Athelia sp. TMB]|nr:hypothetical protein HWV62_33067 [Athelia sp. TMB]
MDALFKLMEEMRDAQLKSSAQLQILTQDVSELKQNLDDVRRDLSQDVSELKQNLENVRRDLTQKVQNAQSVNDQHFADANKGVQNATIIIKGFFDNFHESLQEFLGTVHTTIRISMNEEAERVIKLQAPKFDGLENAFIRQACKWSASSFILSSLSISYHLNQHV